MKREIKFLAMSALALCLVVIGAAEAGWDDCQPMIPEEGGYILAGSDGNGGAVILTHVDTGLTTEDLVVTRVDENGETVYTSSLSDEYVFSDNTALATTSDGGAYVLYYANGDTKVRAINGDGSFAGPLSVLAFGNGTAFPNHLQIENDNNGGAWACYLVQSPVGTGFEYDAMLDHLDEFGAKDFSVVLNSFQAHGTSVNKFDMAVTPQGLAYVSIDVSATGGEPGLDVRVQSCDLNGTTGLGVQVVTNGGSSDQRDSAVACLADGSVAVVFHNSGSSPGLYAQRLEHDSSYYYWSPGGALILNYAAGGNLNWPDVESDGLGGAIIAFKYSGTNGVVNGIRAQRLTASGQALWQDSEGTPGLMVGSATAPPRLQYHGGGGAIVGWAAQNGFYAEAIDGDGNQMWPDEDHLLCSGHPTGVTNVFSDGNHGALLVTSFGGVAMGARVPWAILDSQGHADYDIVPRSTGTTFRPTGVGNFEVGFHWKTYGLTDEENDSVTFTGGLTNPYNCWLNAGQTMTLNHSSNGVLARVGPSPDGATLHQILWTRKNCELPCTYKGYAYSGDGLNQSSGAAIKLLILACPEEYVEPPQEKGELSFGGAQPNPFNPSTQLEFYIPESAGQVTLRIFNLRGELVRDLTAEGWHSGWNQMAWHGDDRNGARVPSGVYFARLSVDGQAVTQKLALLK